MLFSIYDRFKLEVIRKDGRWMAFRIGERLKRSEDNLVFPPDLTEDGLVTYLDDIYHELASPGKCITKLS